MKDTTRKLPGEARSLNRRDLLRNAGLLGAGAVGLGIVGCKQRPDEDLIDPATTPLLLQQGGTVSATISGLLTGAAAAGVTVRFVGAGKIVSDSEGTISVRLNDAGDYVVEFSGPGYVPRTGVIRVAGNVAISVSLLEDDEGLPRGFLDAYARGTGSGKGVTIDPRTPGRTNRWTQPPTYRIYRRLADSSKEFVTDARVDAMRASILALFPALTANTVGIPSIQVRSSEPPATLNDVPNGAIAVAQRKSAAISSEHTGALNNRYTIAKGMIGCGHESSIELFNRMVAHSTGAYGVSSTGSIVSATGSAALSDRDAKAATFLYSRAAGNMAPDKDADATLLN